MRITNIRRFDKIEFDVLEASYTGMFYNSPESDNAKRALLLMSEDIIKNNPFEKWSETGWKLTEKGHKYYLEFMELVREKHGHIWKTDDDGNIDIFAYSAGYHNGMVCKNCGYSFCKHCNSEFDIPECKNKAIIIE